MVSLIRYNLGSWYPASERTTGSLRSFLLRCPTEAPFPGKPIWDSMFSLKVGFSRFCSGREPSVIATINQAHPTNGRDPQIGHGCGGMPTGLRAREIGFQAIAEALGLVVKAAVAITAIIAGGRLAGLSTALGAFLADLLLAETEFSLHVESDIAHIAAFYWVGMSIDPKLLVSNFPFVVGSLGLLLNGKSLLVALIGKLSGISIISAIRVGLLLAPGGEFAFVAFGETVNQLNSSKVVFNVE
ncbi:hypothetical protein ACLB2K_004765 [Fragaria x ananassa]